MQLGTFNNPFLQLLTKQGSLSAHMLTVFKKKGFGDATLFAFAMEAAGNPKDQAKVAREIFLQVARLYQEHPDAMAEYKEYLIKENNTYHLFDDVLSRLFASEEKVVNRLSELAKKVADNTSFSSDDFFDMNFFALPFNLQYIAGRMDVSFRMHKENE